MFCMSEIVCCFGKLDLTGKIMNAICFVYYLVHKLTASISKKNTNIHIHKNVYSIDDIGKSYRGYFKIPRDTAQPYSHIDTEYCIVGNELVSNITLYCSTPAISCACDQNTLKLETFDPREPYGP